MARDRLVNPLEIAKITTPGTNSAANFLLLYPKADGLLYAKDGAGSEYLIGGGQFVYSKTGNYTIANSQGRVIVLCNASGGAFTITLMAPASFLNIVTIIKTDTSVNKVTVESDGAETISGQNNWELTNAYETWNFMSDLTNIFAF